MRYSFMMLSFCIAGIIFSCINASDHGGKIAEVLATASLDSSSFDCDNDFAFTVQVEPDNGSNNYPDGDFFLDSEVEVRVLWEDGYVGEYRDSLSHGQYKLKVSHGCRTKDYLLEVPLDIEDDPVVEEPPVSPPTTSPCDDPEVFALFSLWLESREPIPTPVSSEYQWIPFYPAPVIANSEKIRVMKSDLDVLVRSDKFISLDGKSVYFINVRYQNKSGWILENYL